MTINPDQKLLEALFQRHSVRSFQAKQPGERILTALRSEISYATSRDAAIHFQLKLNDDAPFKGFTASYGMFYNAVNYLACVVDTSYDDCLQRAGYWAEMFALKAVNLGLGTCFVSGTFKASRIAAQMRVTWRLPFIVLFGYPEERETTFMARMMRKIAGSNIRPSAEKVLGKDSLPFDTVREKWPELITPLEAVACAPSAMNRHPVRIRINGATGDESPSVTASLIKENSQSDIDLGIALANWEVAAGGEWEYGQRPEWLAP